MSSYHSQEQTLAQLPLPSEQEIEHSKQLINAIVLQLGSDNGVLSFYDFMNSVLYQPGLGYYSAGSTKIGAGGDFVTAPEISVLFGRCLARQCESAFGQGCDRNILEFGAGRGSLCLHLLESLDQLESYNIIEISADLRQRQEDFLSTNLPPSAYQLINWLDRLPRDFDGVVIGNEVLDAMPVHVVIKDENWRELGVGYQQERFHWLDYTDHGEAVSTIKAIEGRVGELPQGYCTEINLNYQPWLSALNDSCNKALILMIDYGFEEKHYYHPQRINGTLNCHYRHRRHSDPFVYPGLQDITAFVDFDAFANAASVSGFSICGLASQRDFLLANGLLEDAGVSDREDSNLSQFKRAQEIKTLTLPGEMGDSFKVIGLQKNLKLELPALSGGDTV